MSPSVPNPSQGRPPQGGWRRGLGTPSLPESHSSITIPSGVGVLRKLFAFAGPGLLVAVGYMDPGNWATDLAGGAKFGYTLLFVVLVSNLMAILLQHLALKLGVVAERDLAQACRDHFSRPVYLALWVLCEIAIVACDLAEVIGSAIALNLLFHIPLIVGVLITAMDVHLILFLQYRGFRTIEVLVGSLIGVIGFCFAYEIVVSRPEIGALLGGLVPKGAMVANPEMLYVAMGILGATVMPHNLYLHSSIVQTRAFPRDDAGKRMAVRYASIDSTLALFAAFFINAAILIVSSAAFHGTAYQEVADINDAHRLLAPVLGAPLASLFFALALLASGQSSTLTGTLAGQIVMEGFLDFRLRPWVRRLSTRLLAVGPAVIVAALYGERGVGRLLVLSQVVLSLQLGFAVVPLVIFTDDPRKMGRFRNRRWLSVMAWLTTGLIVTLNAYLLLRTVFGWIA